LTYFLCKKQTIYVSLLHFRLAHLVYSKSLDKRYCLNQHVLNFDALALGF